MARKYENSKNFAIIELTFNEADNVGFGPICDNCNDILMLSHENVYYISVLNRLFCKNCLEEWINSPYTRRHEEDNHYEKVHYNYYAEKLNLETI